MGFGDWRGIWCPTPRPHYHCFVRRNLVDKPLMLLDIMEKNAPQAEFAFLSVCYTAVGDVKRPDEVIHLAAGLQFSGFNSVTGTLWTVDDAVAKHVVEVFYHNMFEDLEDGDVDCTKATLALSHATCAVKKIVPLEQRIVLAHIDQSEVRCKRKFRECEWICTVNITRTEKSKSCASDRT
ncbi:uncharacterized protein EDB91DRAFT_1147102 [Suillus paluster]|uniref:uncharacterized protein n=1 Tax=Suillus paluster TaxID=48578 RepID=UPI001B878DEF|nr:uncharacterized protein EDB91DRAFT_1147102 [Suillus paluster]KAG1734257.1 hypothetical protein EDB91DRAFT_1147102 [Suillus paluster]